MPSSHSSGVDGSESHDTPAEVTAQQASIADDPYTAGRRRPSTCRLCGSPVWIVYHGPARNHSVEPREDR